MRIDLLKVPFSRFGSYLKVYEKNGELVLSSVHGNHSNPDLFSFQLPMGCTVDALPWEITISQGEQTMRMFLLGSDRLILNGNLSDVKLRFVNTGLYAFMHVLEEQKFIRGTDSLNCRFVSLYAHEGQICLDAAWKVEEIHQRLVCEKSIVSFGGSYTIELFLHQDEEAGAPLEKLNCENEIAAVLQEYQSWRSRFRLPLEKYVDAFELAVYILWMSGVSQAGQFPSEAVLMSKNWMNRVWSWDHCFIALALTGAWDSLAWQQFLLPFECQSSNGKLPDSITDHGVKRIYTKPPIHGFCYQKLLEKGFRPSVEQQLEVCDKLIRWTEWWLHFRDDDGDLICQYNHGNESGWDNSSAFDFGVPMESPELSAFLYLQMEAIVSLLDALGRNAEISFWRNLQAAIRIAFSSHCMEDGLPVCRRNAAIVETDSLLPYVSMICGELTGDSAERMACKIMEDFIGPRGLATEALSSKKFAAGGSYWRGPMWAPVVYLITEALKKNGFSNMAQTIAELFCDTVRNSGGMYENYDAVTGEGYDDPAYTWTASVFILLAGESRMDER